MEKARYNTELYSNLSEPLNNVKPSNFWGSHHNADEPSFYSIRVQLFRKRLHLFYIEPSKIR